MNNKQLAEMVKKLRKKKLEEIVGKPPPFNPVHPEGKQDASSPNQYAHRKQSVVEASKKQHHIKEIVGPTHASSLNMTTGNIDKTTIGRKKFQGGNQKRSIRSYTAEENKKEVELGPTDTGQTGETVTHNPTDNMPSTTGSTNKNTTNKELKEKKNATMG